MVYNQSRVKCEICTHSINGHCEYCKFEYDEDYNPFKTDNWDILNLNDDVEWSHLQIQYRLWSKGIECLMADIWWDNNLAYLIGVKASRRDVADALNVHEEVVYDVGEMPLLIINLFQEKYLRGDLCECKS